MQRIDEQDLVGQWITLGKPHGEYFRDPQGRVGVLDMGKFFVEMEGDWEQVPFVTAKQMDRFRNHILFFAKLNGEDVLFDWEPKRLGEAFHKLLYLPEKREPLLRLLEGTMLKTKRRVTDWGDVRYMIDVFDSSTGAPARPNNILPFISKEEINRTQPYSKYGL